MYFLRNAVHEMYLSQKSSFVFSVKHHSVNILQSYKSLIETECQKCNCSFWPIMSNVNINIRIKPAIQDVCTGILKI